MQFTLDMGSAQYQIRSYEAGRIRINDSDYLDSLIISPTLLIADWGPTSLDELTEAHIEQLLATDMEVLLLGTGERQRFPAMALMQLALSRGRVLDVMDTHAACRTFAVLAAEGRKVAAALILE